MRRPEPRSAVTSFLSALADDLSAPPDEMTTRRHVTAAAAIVRSARRDNSTRVTRWAAAALISLTGFGTGGVAVAGGLPAPFQEAAADVARVLPLPISVPYPRAAEVSPAATSDVGRRPLDGEPEADIDPVVEIESSQTSPSPAAASAERVGSADAEPAETSYESEGHDRHRAEPGDGEVFGYGGGDDESRDHEDREEDWSHRDDRWREQAHRGDQGRDGDDQEDRDDNRWSDDDRSGEDSRSDDERRSDGEGHDRD
jgi:hypothetical protein